MRRIEILVTSEPFGGTAPFVHDDVAVHFHRWSQLGELPLIEGELWAFVDWVLPTMSGLEACRRLRCDPVAAEAHITLVLEEDDVDLRRRALRHGADDYMLGPVDRTALLDRVLAVQIADDLSREPRTIHHGSIAINLAAHQASYDGAPVPLMPNELRLLRYFLEHPGRVFTREQLIHALGKQEPPLDERTVDVWIGRLRRALRQVGAGNPLRTIRSLGYVFDG
ncbi:response regulator transcription factor [Croceicoccus sp. BE223]|uniref:response regulator transcription factor n=1 Tax=Croceicoccus sp. BE223 TaxID=2817716 RepID=UPI002861940A|nr:response regulator transcription factor [Croceicoccus sp. BE223]MDR7101929.1 two-component system phosphate regulon response regulator PhoB [Croceicoccus sp. BE223]